MHIQPLTLHLITIPRVHIMVAAQPILCVAFNWHCDTYTVIYSGHLMRHGQNNVIHLTQTENFEYYGYITHPPTHTHTHTHRLDFLRLKRLRCPVVVEKSHSAITLTGSNQVGEESARPKVVSIHGNGLYMSNKELGTKT